MLDSFAEWFSLMSNSEFSSLGLGCYCQFFSAILEELWQSKWCICVPEIYHQPVYHSWYPAFHCIWILFLFAEDQRWWTSAHSYGTGQHPCSSLFYSSHIPVSADFELQAFLWFINFRGIARFFCRLLLLRQDFCPRATWFALWSELCLYLTLCNFSYNVIAQF